MRKHKMTHKQEKQFRDEYKRLMVEMCDNMLQYRDDLVTVMRDTGLSKGFDFVDMASAAFLYRLKTCVQIEENLKEAKNLLSEFEEDE